MIHHLRHRGTRSCGSSGSRASWKDAGIDIAKNKDSWYKENGHGMSAALSTAATLDADVLSDLGSWLAFKYPGDLGIVVEGGKRLFNQYSVMLVIQLSIQTSKRIWASNSSIG